MKAIVKFWCAIVTCIISGMLLIGCSSNQSASKKHASGKKKNSADVIMDGAYVIPDDHRLFKHDDIFLNFNAKGGKRTVKYNKQSCPFFLCATSEDWLICMNNDTVAYQTAKDPKGRDCFILQLSYIEHLNRFYSGDIVNNLFITTLVSQYFHYNGVLGIDLDRLCCENKFAMPMGEDKWIRAIFDLDKHTIQFQVKPNNTGKCRVLTLVMSDQFTCFPLMPYLNNAIRIFQRHD